MTAAQFKADVCSRVTVLMSCAGVDIDVQYYPAGTTITITDPIDAGGNYNSAALGYVTRPAARPAPSSRAHFINGR